MFDCFVEKFMLINVGCFVVYVEVVILKKRRSFYFQVMGIAEGENEEGIGASVGLGVWS